jgi:N-acetylgalactosamine-N,N'-diacetylbacillosaminyl-diphospho-undecaprenol 4-alpha-N-acetylgalactosaminyltransferase
MEKQRVAFIINSLAVGGAERVMATLLGSSREECEEFDVMLVLLDRVPEDYDIPNWLKVERLDCRGSVWRSVNQVSKLIVRQQPDVTLSFLTRANVANVIAMRGRSCVISARINTSAHLAAKPNPALSAAVRLTYPRASKIIAVSDDVGEDLSKIFGVRSDRIVSIPNPVDISGITRKASEPPPITIDGPYIVAVGRLYGIKNFPLLLRAVARARLPHKLVILGEGPDRQALTNLISALGLEGRVLLPGRLANPFPLIAGADVFALTSNGEGFPNALVEAMALGVPVVATDCPSGPSEIIAETARGIIESATLAPHGVLTPLNNIAEFAAALTLAVRPEIRERLSRAGVARALCFEPASIKDKYWSVLRTQLKKSPDASTTYRGDKERRSMGIR